MTRALITGIAGFIGSHLASALVERGDAARGLDNFSTGNRSNLTGLAGKVDLIEADLNDRSALARACQGVDVIFHEAALPSVPRSIADPAASHTANLDGTFALLEAARAAGVRRIVYAASSSAYGNQPGFPRVETMRPEPISPYAVQKLACEYYLQSFWRVYGLETVCLRYFNVFGPRQDPSSQYSGVIARFAAEMLGGRTPTIFGDGGHSRDFTYVENVVAANLLAASATAENCAGQVFNVACGQSYTLNQLYAALAQELNFPHPPQYAPERAGDVRESLADITSARVALGYQPNIGFAEGIARTAAWYRESAR
ncbi:UDP-glucose 4-epimerase [Bryocella elongata]|uniref:UDP-glucose 4-epimerase n=1 Tax=Bryocella elongata TaxID=863522 RepID=A0A1H5XQN2_9BACT|nr:SDR family oxidoreductase [Bryocella elongata]SEG13805.1 UDP-glucose 4-epimerase [Bryocella elongata]